MRQINDQKLMLPVMGPSLIPDGEWLKFPGMDLPATEFTDTPQKQLGLYLSAEPFSSGEIEVLVDFMPDKIKDRVSQPNDQGVSIDLIYSYDTRNKYSYSAGVSLDGALAIRSFKGSWEYQAGTTGGGLTTLQRPVKLKVIVQGSTVSLEFDGIEAVRAVVNRPSIKSNAGILIVSNREIRFKDFKVRSMKPRAFEAMQFTSPFNEVYFEVIQMVCAEAGVEVERIDEVSQPGYILADIRERIEMASFVIADISPANPNVYYEVGYSHGIGRPTILLASKGTSLPFDVAQHRTIFYEDSILGKRLLEEGLRRSIRSVLDVQVEGR